MIRFYIYQSKMPTTLGKFIAKTLANNNITINELVDLVADSKTSLGKGDIRGVIETLCHVIEREVTTGNSVQLGGICTLRPTIRGTFASVSSGFDPLINSIEVAVAAGSRLRKAVQDSASVEKVLHEAPAPDLVEYTDVASGSVNTVINGGSLGQLEGTNLDYDSEQADEGLFLKDNIAATPVKVTVIQTATAGRIVFMVPQGEPSAETAHLLVRRRNKAEGPLIEGQSVTMDFTPSAVAVGV